MIKVNDIATKFSKLNNSIKLASSKNKEHLEEALVNALKKHGIVENPEKILNPSSILMAIEDFESDMGLSYEEYQIKKSRRLRYSKIIFWIRALSFFCGIALSFWISNDQISEVFQLEIDNLRNKEKNLPSLASFEMLVNLYALMPIIITFIVEFFFRIITEGGIESNYKSAKSNFIFIISFIFLSIVWALTQITYRTAIDTYTVPALTKFVFFISNLIPSVMVVSLPFILRSLWKYYSATFPKKL